MDRRRSRGTLMVRALIYILRPAGHSADLKDWGETAAVALGMLGLGSVTGVLGELLNIFPWWVGVIVSLLGFVGLAIWAVASLQQRLDVLKPNNADQLSRTITAFKQATEKTLTRYDVTVDLPATQPHTLEIAKEAAVKAAYQNWVNGALQDWVNAKEVLEQEIAVAGSRFHERLEAFTRRASAGIYDYRVALGEAHGRAVWGEHMKVVREATREILDDLENGRLSEPMQPALDTAASPHEPTS